MEYEDIQAELQRNQTVKTMGEQSSLGLCIRCLNKHLLSVVLGFLGERSDVPLVCKYWLEIAREIQNACVEGSEYVYR